jgi:hypothetical protein
MGRFWCGNWLLVDEFVAKYGLKNLRELHAWLGKTIAWAETSKTKRPSPRVTAENAMTIAKSMLVTEADLAQLGKRKRKARA